MVQYVKPMSVPQNLRKRINFQGDFEVLLSDVASSYGLGKLVSFDPIEMGYEDLNINLVTSKGNYFVKIFAEGRDNAECLRLINVVKTAIDNGVTHPEFLKRDTGYIFRERYEDFNIRLAVFEFVKGQNFYELGRKPTEAELKEVIKLATIINSIDHKPAELYDPWALVNFPAELKKAKKFLSEEELETLEKLKLDLEKVNLKSLPHALVHGDLVSTNLIKTSKKIYCVDFSVANYYPRIVELAVLMSDLFFDPSGKNKITDSYDFLLKEYQKHIKLTKEELEILPLFVKLAHAMHIIGGTLEKNKKKNKSPENEHWLELGKKGLAQSLKAWSK